MCIDSSNWHLFLLTIAPFLHSSFGEHMSVRDLLAVVAGSKGMLQDGRTQRHSTEHTLTHSHTHTHTHTHTLNLERRPSMDDAFLSQSDRLKQMTRFD